MPSVWDDLTRTTTASMTPPAAAVPALPAAPPAQANPGQQPAQAAEPQPAASLMPMPPDQRHSFLDETATAGGFSAKPRQDRGKPSTDPG